MCVHGAHTHLQSQHLGSWKEIAMSSRAAWVRQQDLVSDGEKEGTGKEGVLQSRKREEDRTEIQLAQPTGRWKSKLLLASPVQQTLWKIGVVALLECGRSKWRQCLQE